MLRIEPHPDTGSATSDARLQPRASKNEIAGEIDGALRVRLQAPALEDRANQALVEFLARVLRTPKSAVRLLSGERSRNKRVEVRGVSAREIELLLIEES